ncbi:TIGR00266 family protein [Acinetobacter proteolyticus]|uniref:TIGR00266 family protein n=1 Tax=Acinetobacter proteolyticus TaxID=1776741 RepID=A0ABP2TPQ9_9GAMM|nr:TIGR00266 family protein [Acinetobacter proteolyticus]ENU24318.1 TIGR00266 family protein [Acinetobacter proteolyticus]
MAQFSLVGSPEPFLHVSMRRGDKIYCESNAMVMMEAPLELKGRLQGGLMQSLLRRFANDESLFQQHIEAVRGDGDCLLSAALDGDMQILDVGTTQYLLSDGAFVAAHDSVEVKARLNSSLGGAFFGNTGGFLVMETSGQGQVVVSGCGTLFELEVEPNKEVIIDNGHVVCWDSRLNYNLSVSTSQSSGFLGNLVNSVTSGEGMVLRFSGQGKVVICSRNRNNFLQWLTSKLNLNRNQSN